MCPNLDRDAVVTGLMLNGDIADPEQAATDTEQQDADGAVHGDDGDDEDDNDVKDEEMAEEAEPDNANT